MKLICDLLAGVDRHTSSKELAYALAAIALLISISGVIYRAKKENWNFSFMGKSYFEFEFFNWNKYGIFAVLKIVLFLALILTILLLPALNRYCKG
jgi:hypothetical protein